MMMMMMMMMIPLTKILRKAKAGYMLDDIKVNHLLFMDDLKVRKRTVVDSLVTTVQVFSRDIGMEFGIKKCGVTVLKRCKLNKTEGSQLVNGETIKEVCEEGYKYLRILELDKVKEQEMDIFRNEYMQRLKLVMKSKLNGRNKIKAGNTSAVSVLRYGGGVIGWTKEELQSMDRKTRKVITINEELHPRSDTARICVPRKRGGRGLISCEACVWGGETVWVGMYGDVMRFC
ncbi:uncharacterized protein [Montipora capricornis]|uniref:uncharacterized protein n=1 Tax=Montipora capricornis TaxID=246305 RepID=UPI0035F13C37